LSAVLKNRLELSVRSLDGRRGPSRALLNKALKLALADMPSRAYLVEIAYADDRIMKQLNRKYHGSSVVTDVLAFPAHQQLPGGEYLLGEIIVNRDEARRCSADGGGIQVELTRYVVHGVLHLAGYDDSTPSLRSRMWETQESIMRSIVRNGDK